MSYRRGSEVTGAVVGRRPGGPLMVGMFADRLAAVRAGGVLGGLAHWFPQC